MADVTYNDHPEDNSPTANDYIPYWDVADSQAKRALRSALVGAILAGGGTIDTGGHTLTVPASGTAALLGAAQTFSALQTFSAGLSFGAQTLAAYAEGTWTPVITGSTNNPTVTYTIQDGVYTRIGRVVFYSFHIRISTISGGSGNVHVSLPSTAASGGGALSMTCSSYHINVDLPGSNIVGFRFSAISGAAYGQFSIDYDNSTPAALEISALGSNKSLGASGFYFV